MEYLEQQNNVGTLVDSYLKRLDALQAEQKELKAEVEELKKSKAGNQSHRLNRVATVSVLQNSKKDIKEVPKKPEPIKQEPKVQPPKKLQSEKKISLQIIPEPSKQISNIKQVKEIKKGTTAISTNLPAKIQQTPKPKDPKVIPVKPVTATKRQEKKQEKKQDKKQEKKVATKQPIKKDQKKIVNKTPQPIKKAQSNQKTTVTTAVVAEKKEQVPPNKNSEKVEETIKNIQNQKLNPEFPLVDSNKQDNLEFGHEQKIEPVAHHEQDNQIEQNLIKQIGGDAKVMQHKAMDQHIMQHPSPLILTD